MAEEKEEEGQGRKVTFEVVENDAFYIDVDGKVLFQQKRNLTPEQWNKVSKNLTNILNLFADMSRMLPL